MAAPELPDRLTPDDITKLIKENPGCVTGNFVEVIIALPGEIATYRRRGDGQCEKTSSIRI